MKFLSLNIENFLVLTEAKIALADRGLVLIQGANNEDTSANSNGAGKSSIADALCWAIYGVTARGETGDQVINNKAGKNTRVEVVIFDDLTHYRIVRHRKHKTGKNALHVFMDDGTGEKDLTKGTDKLTQEVVDKIIGASLEVFTGSIYAGQEKMPDLPSMTDKMLKILIEEAAGINALEAAYKKARENAQAAKADYDAAQNQLVNTQGLLAMRENQLAQFVQSEQDWETHRTNQVKALTERAQHQVAEAKRLAAEAPQAEIDRLTSEIGVIDAKIAAVGTEQQELARLQKVVMDATIIKRTADTALSNAQHAVSTLTNRAKQAEHQLGCPCTECGRPLTENEIGSVISDAKNKLSEAMDHEVACLDAQKDAQSAQEAAQSAMQSFQQSMTDVSAEAAQRAVLEGQRSTLAAKDRERQKVIDAAKSDVETIKRLKEEKSPFVGQITNQQTLIDTAKGEIASLTGLVAVKQAKMDLEQEVVKVFAPAGVRARVLDEVTPYLNGQTSKYLSILSDGNITAEWSTLTVSKAGEMKEKFAIDVQSGISAKTFKGLSGGEKRKVRVATALALQDLVATRATKPIDLFVGDEIDDALDASGLERLMIILEDKAKERGTVMVISHNSLKDEIRNVLTVERTVSGDTKIMETVA